MMTPWKKKKVKRLKEQEKTIEDKLIELIGVDNNGYWALWSKKETVVSQIIKIEGTGR